MLNFGVVGTGTVTSRKLKIKNTGSGKLIFEVDLSLAPDYMVMNGSKPVLSETTPFTVLAGNSKSLTVIFNPGNVARLWPTEYIGINSSDVDNGYFTIPIYATSVGGTLKIIPKKVRLSGVNFGDVAVGAQKTESLELTNVNKGILYVTVEDSLISPFAVSPNDVVTEDAIYPGKSFTVTVTFDPTDAVTYPTQYLTITSTDPSPDRALIQLPVNGTGD